MHNAISKILGQLKKIKEKKYGIPKKT